ncbi:MAG: hypothetical protein JNM17_40905 [Archangium sp.]|nr:hypothetical protein [Archangium sp.]
MRRLGFLVSCGLMACSPNVIDPQVTPPPPCPVWPAELDFGEVEVGTSAARDLPSHVISSPSVAPVDPPFFFSLDGVRSTVRVTFTATDALLHLAELRGAPGASCPEQTVTLRALGSGTLSAGQRLVDFGAIGRGETRTRTVKVFNTRRTAVAVALSTVDDVPWLVFSPISFLLPPGGEQDVTFVATTGNETGQQTVGVRMTTARDAVQVLVTMKPQLPRLSISKSPDESEWLPFFGVSDVVSRTFQITNVGLAELDVKSVDVFPEGPQLASRPQGLLAPGASAPVTIFFDTNTPVGSHIWNVRFITDDPTQPDAGTRYQFDSRAFAPCDPGLVFERTVSRPTPAIGGVLIDLDVTNSTNGDCLIDDIHFDPPTASVISGKQLIIPANNTRPIRINANGAERSLLFFRPMRPGSNYERVVIDTR